LRTICTGLEKTKTNEDSTGFRTEAVVLNILRGDPAFQSNFPKPQEVYECAKPPQWLVDAKVCWIDAALKQEVFVYDADPGYFIYLHDGRLLYKEWSLARNGWLHDFVRLVKNGLYPVIAPLFHNGSTGRQYLPITDVFAEGKKHTWGTGGAGRCEAPFAQTEYPNVGATGARDVGDFMTHAEATTSPNIFSSDIPNNIGNATRNFIESNVLARTLLVDAVLLAKRYRNQNRLDWRDEKLLDEAAQELSECAWRLLAEYTGKDHEKCRQLVEGTIDWKRAARQLLFWSQNNSSGYLPYVKEKTLPEKLYAESVIFSTRRIPENFDNEIGFNTEGSQDLGPYNGPLGLDELERSWYLVTGLAIALGR